MTYHHREAVGFIWAIADLLRGTYKAHDYGDVILPLVVLRRLDQALVDTKTAVVARDAELAAQGIDNREPVLRSSQAGPSTTPRRSRSIGCSMTSTTSRRTCAPTSRRSRPTPAT